jgi:molecular chaperone GrpE
MPTPNQDENIQEQDLNQTSESTENTPENLAEESAELSDNQVEITETLEAITDHKLAGELTEAKDKYLRLYAEFENFRRRTAKEKTDLIKTAGEGILASLLPILDDFERAQKSMENNAEKQAALSEEAQKEISALKEGVQLTYNKLFRILEQKGLKPMESTIGKGFDVNEHESITQIPAPNEDMKGKVIDEIERGYYLHDKILRFAKVVVGS